MRSPIITKPVSGPISNGSSPLNRGAGRLFGTCLGDSPWDRATMALVCSGVVPQQPPTRFTRPSRANSCRYLLVSSGSSSCEPNSFGRPALGWQATYVGAMRARSSTNGRISFAPSEQLTPTMNGRACSTDVQNASTVWPERLRPLRSTAVNEIQSGSCGAASCAATIAAFAFSVSKIVSISRMSTPPSASAAICSAYASRTSSNVTARYAGSSTFGESDSVTLSGPTEPATKPPNSSATAAREPRAFEAHLGGVAPAARSRPGRCASP